MSTYAPPLPPPLSWSGSPSSEPGSQENSPFIGAAGSSSSASGSSCCYRANLRGRRITGRAAIARAVINNKLALTLLAVAVIGGTFAFLGGYNVLPMPDCVIGLLGGGSTIAAFAAIMRKLQTSVCVLPTTPPTSVPRLPKVNPLVATLAFLAIAAIAGTFAFLGGYHVLTMPDCAIGLLGGSSAISAFAAFMIMLQTSIGSHQD